MRRFLKGKRKRMGSENGNKKITATLGELIAAEPSLRRVCALPLRDKGQPEGISPATKYHLVKLSRLVAQETRHFATEQEAIFTDLGIVAGQNVSELQPGVWAEYLRRMKPHSEIEVVIDWAPVLSSDIPLALASDLHGLGPLCELVEPKE